MRTICLLLLLANCCAAAELVVTNGDFEAGQNNAASGWKWWSRAGTGSAEWTNAEHHTGTHSVRIQYASERDWGFSSESRFEVKPGQAYLASAWVKVKTGKVTLAVVALQAGKTLAWSIGSATALAGGDWLKLEAVAEVPEECDQVYVRFVGERDTLVWVDDVTLQPWEVPPPEAKPKVQGYAAERVGEKLDRGLVALPAPGGKVHVSWRLLEGDPPGVAFNVYRRAGGDKPVRLNAEPISKTTDFVDSTATADAEQVYIVRAVTNGEEAAPSSEARATPSQAGSPHVAIRLQGDYTFQKVGIADLDGDGRYDFVIKQPDVNIDPYSQYWKRSADTYKLEAYSADGKFLWRYDLGWAIEQGIWYSPYIVYDLDGDGKAEVAVKTGEGDPRDIDGRVKSGPEKLTILDGLTGKPVVSVPWPSRDVFKEGDGYNYSSRNQLGVAYLDGKTPCLIVERGTYNIITVVAYEFQKGQLRELWRWCNETQPRRYWGQGAHWLQAVDLDDDGRDEVVIGSAVIDDNGTSLWSTGLGHPDHCYIGDLDPSRPGLEIYYGLEPARARNTMCMVDAKTGRILWGINKPTRHVHSNGLCSDIDPRHPGAECYSADTNEKKGFAWSLMHTCKGEVIEQDEVKGFGPRTVYWDADPQRELLHGGRIRKFHGGELPPRVEGTFVAVADVLGDWREEIITSVPGELRIYTTTIAAADRRIGLMQDRLYRMDVAVAAMGYYQVPMLSYDLATKK